MKLFNKFRVKLLIILIGLMAVPLIIYGLISINNTTDIITADTYDENHEMAEGLAKDVDYILTSSENMIALATGAQSLKNMHVGHMQKIVDKLVDRSEYIANAYVMDQSGMQIYKTTGELGSRSDRGYFQAAIEGKATFSDVIISRSRGVPIVVHAAPIEKNGEVVGVLGASIDLGILSTLAAETKPGKTGYGFIVDQNGKTIAHPDEEVVMENKDVSHIKPVQEVMKGNNGNTLYTNEGEEKLSSYEPVQKTGWGVVVQLTSAEALNAVDNTIWRTVIIIGITILIGLAAAYFLGNYITAPILAVEEHTGKVANGDLTQEVSAKFLQRKDELGSLAESVNEMTKNLREVVYKISDISNNLSSSSQQLSASSEEISASAEEVGSAIEEVASGAEEQSAQIDETSKNVEGLVAQVETVKDKSDDMDNQADNVMDNINEGDEAIDDSIDQVKEVKVQSSAVSNRINELGELSEEIGNIVELINDISAQTNLLALNAAIEAARAGEAGRGFSVIADEIRELAEESSQATEQIAGLINDIQSGVKETINQMNKAEDAVDNSVGAIETTEDSFDKIDKAAKNLRALIEEISQSAQQMAENTNDVSASIEEISAVSQKASSNAEEVAATSEEQSASTQEIVTAAEELSSMAEQLSDTVNNFKI
ncbi:MAG TPA: methyl-accepting chemotaxis protein [Halanaerobiales bacterium]|nr:methyl-accepting chemotaxis protein [Halanaerobiales bacterium]